MDYQLLLDLDTNLTDNQKTILSKLASGMTQKETAKELNIGLRSVERTVQRVRKKAELLQHTNNTQIPSGYHIKGTSTLQDADGTTKLQWVKIDQDAVDKLEALKEAVHEIAETIEGRAKPMEVPAYTDADQMTVYTIGDAHIGMYAWAAEAGEDFNLEIAEHDLIESMTRLVKSSPCSDTAMIVDVGDFFHADNQMNETAKSANKLDVDSRWAKVLQIGLNIMVALVDKALTKHRTIIVRNAIGNHNEHSAIFLSVYLSSWFRNEPRVIVEKSPAMFWYHHFGKNLFGVTHGHTAKPQELGEIMAHDCESIWSDTQYRYWFTGHIHHDSVKEFRTCKVESFRTLAAKDSWHAGAGYRSGRDMKAIVFHKDYGEIQRHTVNVAMLKRKIPPNKSGGKK